MSDLHFGRHDLTVMEDLLSSVNDNCPDLVVVSGDLTQRARHAEFAAARRFLDRISQPKLVVPGNHDVPLYNVFARFMTPLAKYDHYVLPAAHPANLFHDDEIAVLGLNTTRSFTRKNGRVSIEQIAQIGRVFRDVPEKTVKALVTHHPLGIPSGEAPLELAGRSRLALEAIAKVGVHLLLSGHHHRALSGGLAGTAGGGSVIVLHAGTAISTRLRGGQGNTYNLIHLAKERISVRFMEWRAGQGFYENRRVSYVFHQSRWAPQ
ncbi:MAG: metallophosphoesterase family protein [Candidatus Sulfotelmatobacter sp.]